MGEIFVDDFEALADKTLTRIGTFSQGIMALIIS